MFLHVLYEIDVEYYMYRLEDFYGLKYGYKRIVSTYYLSDLESIYCNCKIELKSKTK